MDKLLLYKSATMTIGASKFNASSRMHAQLSDLQVCTQSFLAQGLLAGHLVLGLCQSVMAKKMAKQCATYSRISSRKQLDGKGLHRQRKAAEARMQSCFGKHGRGACTHHAEVISGTKGLSDRPVLKKLLSQKSTKIFIESARALARSAQVGEDIFRTAQANDVEVIPADLPNMFALRPQCGKSNEENTHAKQH